MRIDTWKFENVDDVQFYVDPEGMSVDDLIGAIEQAATDALGVDVYRSKDRAGWQLFTSAPSDDILVCDFSVKVEAIGASVLITPAFFTDPEGEDLPLEDLALILYHAAYVYAMDQAEVDEVLGAVLNGLPEDDDEAITIDIVLDDDFADGLTVEWEGDTVQFTPPPRPVPLPPTPLPLPLVGDLD